VRNVGQKSGQKSKMLIFVKEMFVVVMVVVRKLKLNLREVQSENMCVLVVSGGCRLCKAAMHRNVSIFFNFHCNTKEKLAVLEERVFILSKQLLFCYTG